MDALPIAILILKSPFFRKSDFCSRSQKELLKHNGECLGMTLLINAKIDNMMLSILAGISQNLNEKIKSNNNNKITQIKQEN